MLCPLLLKNVKLFLIKHLLCISAALGTLYAFQKAARLAKEVHNLDIESDLKIGKISVGLFHTAGKGTRLAPLPGAENNNKPGVKLPTTIKIGDQSLPISILEAVIKQTGCYAKSRFGRLSVFWGDQVFIPTVSVEYTAAYHADILCSLGPMMSETEWREKGMDKYGLIAQAAGGAAQVCKLRSVLSDLSPRRKYSVYCTVTNNRVRCYQIYHPRDRIDYSDAVISEELTASESRMLIYDLCLLVTHVNLG